MSNPLLSIESINEASPAEFSQIFKNVVEHSPDVAKTVATRRPFADRKALIEAFNHHLDELKCEAKVQILKSHPDLAGTLFESGELTPESLAEQRLAGIHKLDATQKSDIASLNHNYYEKFDFPFVVCVRASNTRIERILEGLRERYPNPRYREIIIAMDEVKKICEFRIKHIVSDTE